VLFKPMGSPKPKPSYIASDADYVLLGLRLNRDSERMVLSDLIYDAAREPAGWALIAQPNDKERRFCKRQNIEVIEAESSDLLQEWNTTPQGSCCGDPVN
jgi:hypothetical protein